MFIHGPHFHDDGSCAFHLWAPKPKQVALELPSNQVQTLPMQRHPGGWWTATVPGLRHGQRYWFLLDGQRRRPDPASRWQPDGVHGPSALVDVRQFRWTSPPFRPVPLEQLIIYELHVGTFTPEGTLDAAIAKLPYLAELGVTAVELMPVAAFPGTRNWGYDGVALYAVQDSYGGPLALQRFVDACHQQGLAVILDVVYNHLGPEGNYLREFGPYFTNRYQTPWGQAINYDGRASGPVREYCLQNALWFLDTYRIDGLRLDAVHAIYDNSATHLLAELADRVQDWANAANRRVHRIAESHMNDPQLTTPVAHGGLGMHSTWSDDFHHALHALLTGETDGYYAAYGQLEQLARTLEAGFCYEGDYSPFYGRPHGQPAGHLPATAVTNWLQTHDQTGNRMQGDRIATLAPLAACRVGAVLLLCAPGIPLLFMGEEWAETTPFLYCIDHGDPALVQAVRKGRKREFAIFKRHGEPPDPACETTLQRSRLDWSKLVSMPHAGHLRLYGDLIALRRQSPALQERSRRLTRVWPLDAPQCLAMERRCDGERVLVLANLAAHDATVHCGVYGEQDSWEMVLATEDTAYGGQGVSVPQHIRTPMTLPAWSAVIYRMRP